ncbi:hypothetical protein KSP39_PZI015199 [Platanthera zijinensis]|uniref:Uncharacterized protein n=1 Tax=Platanthera zijinensis TaxID=2320716 RepID=A0AAP0B851_9ASPA
MSRDLKSVNDPTLLHVAGRFPIQAPLAWPVFLGFLPSFFLPFLISSPPFPFPFQQGFLLIFASALRHLLAIHGLPSCYFEDYFYVSLFALILEKKFERKVRVINKKFVL